MIRLTHFKNNGSIYIEPSEIVVIAGHWPQPQSPVNLTPLCTEVYLKSWGHTAPIPVKESRDEVLSLIKMALEKVLH